MTADAMPYVAMRDLRTCVHCGFCLPACPTFQLFGVEMDSPRGRIMQIEAAKRGQILLTDPDLHKHLSLCLACRACETACPSGVPYGRIIEGARASMPETTIRARAIKRVVLRGIFERPGMLELAGTGMRAYQRSGLQRVARSSGLLPPPLREMELLLPVAQGSLLQGARRTYYSAKGIRRARVALFRGCVMQQFFSRTNEATANVVSENGCDVVAPPRASCCGALHVHAGDRDAARRLARRNIEAFLALDPSHIVINAAGCGSTLKEYGELLDDDPVYRSRARAFSERVRDISELLDEVGMRAPRVGIAARLTYQDACHLKHAQRISEQPRALLRHIPGLELVEMDGADTCCGSAGIYNVTQPEAAADLLARKLDNLARTEARLLAVANPGCAMQIASGIRQRGMRIRVVHPVDLLAAAYQRERTVQASRLSATR